LPVNDAPSILAETTLADWAAVGPGWTHLPYLARFSAAGLPADWRALLRGRFHAVLESGRTGSLTIAVPTSARATVFTADGRVVVHADDGAHEAGTDKPLEALRRWSQAHRAPTFPGWPVFQGGLIVALGYELATQFEPVPSARADVPCPSAVFLEATEAFVYDDARHELTVVVLGPVANRPETTWREARRRAVELRQAWQEASTVAAPILPTTTQPAVPLAESLPQPEFEAAVRQVQAYISAGDTYQVNLSTRLEVPVVNPALAYAALRQANPSPYMGLLSLPAGTLACGSPELLVEVTGGRIASRPIAGTRPRGADAAADEAWAQELAGDTKERAEHLMLVDLLRNDVGRVAAPGSVHVPEFMAVEKYSHVMHLVSQVEGRLAAGIGPADVVRALFPGGTITGAPKVRTMQIIAELEPVARGFYTGSIGWIGANGDLCLNIVIRSLWTTAGRSFIQAGAGIVADSQPEREHAESWRKAQAPLLAAARAALPPC
jgi:para-aminobenzoate synthetase component 1